jgi:hypothetical protein
VRERRELAIPGLRPNVELRKEDREVSAYCFSFLHSSLITHHSSIITHHSSLIISSPFTHRLMSG